MVLFVSGSLKIHPEIFPDLIFYFFMKENTMKHKSINPNNRKLAEYYEQNKTKKPQPKTKITFVVPSHYAELLSKLSLLLGNSKTQTIKQALECLASQYDEETIYI